MGKRIDSVFSEKNKHTNAHTSFLFFIIQQLNHLHCLIYHYRN